MKPILPHAVRDAGWLLHMAADERCPYECEGDIVEVGAPVAIAGTGAQGGIEDNTDDEWHRVLDIDVLGPVRVTRAARALYSAGNGPALSLPWGMDGDLPPERIRVDAVAARAACPASPGAASVSGTALTVDGGRDGLPLRLREEGW
jgi:NAD(P)-dependent dehydrogenase (short-subunit alcohol dehydrogenase family)